MRTTIVFNLLSCIVMWGASCNTQSEPGTVATTDTAGSTPAEQGPDTTRQLAAEKPVTDSLAIRIGDQLKNTLVKKDLDILTDNDRQFVYAEIDLNGDQDKEIFVSMKGGYFCGNAGCTVFLLNSAGEKINTFTIVGGPIMIDTNKTKGWNDLIVPSRGRNYIVKFNGKVYPGNPSVQPEFKGTPAASLPTVLTETSTVHHF